LNPKGLVLRLRKTSNALNRGRSGCAHVRIGKDDNGSGLRHLNPKGLVLLALPSKTSNALNPESEKMATEGYGGGLGV